MTTRTNRQTNRQTNKFVKEQKIKVFKHRYSNTQVRELRQNHPFNNVACKVILLVYEYDRLILQLENEEISTDETDLSIKRLKEIIEILNNIGAKP